MNILRQGDVLLVAVPKPKRLNKPAALRSDGKIILAFGEQTGHHHRFHGGATLFEDNTLHVPEKAKTVLRPTAVKTFGDNEIRVWTSDGAIVRMNAERMAEIETALKGELALTFPGSLLRHEEHDAVIIAPGYYRLPGQREFVAPEIERRVQD